MRPTAHILILYEKNDSLLHLLCKYIDTSLFQINSVTTQEKFLEAARLHPQAILICSYECAGINATSLFEACKKYAPGSAFIFIAETMDVHNAVQLMKAGVTDIVLKTDLHAITGVIQQILSDQKNSNQHNQQFTSAEINDQKYNAIVENSLLALFLTMPDGKILEANKRACEMFGYEREELLTIGRQGIIDHTDPNLAIQLKERQQKGKGSGELIGIRKNGERFPIEYSSVLFTGKDGFTYTSTVIADISERRKASEEINLLINNTDEAFVLMNKELNIVSFNQQFQKLYFKYLGIKVEKGRSIIDYAQPERKEIVKDIYKQVIGGGTVSSEIALSVTGEGLKYFSVKYIPAKNDNNQIVGAFVTTTDITERKIAGQQLLANERRFRALVENGMDAVVVLTEEGKPLYISPTIEKILGYTEAEAMNLDLFSLTHPEDLEGVQKVWEQMLKSPGVPVKGYTSRLLHKDGSWRWLEDTVTNLLHDPAVNGIVDNFRDVTEKIQRERQRESERINQEALINSTTDLMWSVTKEFNLIAANKAFYKSMYTSSGVQLKPGDNLMLTGRFPDEFLQFWQTIYERCLQGENFIEDIYTAANEQVKESWAEVSINPIYDGLTITGVACYSRDITQFKQYQTKLVDINKKLQTAQLISRLGYWELDLVTNALYWSDEVYNIWGVSADTFEVNLSNFYYSVHPDDRKRFTENQLPAFDAETILDIEYRIVLQNGTVRHIYQRGEVIYDDKGKSIRFEGIVQDITEQKVAAEALKLNEQQLNLIYNSTAGIIYLIAVEENERYKFISMNRAGLETIGLTEEQITNKYVEEIIPPETLPKALSKYKEVIETGKTVIWEDVFNYPSGIKTGIISVTPIDDGQGHCKRLVVTIHDITERKKAEKSILDSEEKRRLIMNAALDAIICIDMQGDITFWNPQAEKIFGWQEQEVLGKLLADIIIPSNYRHMHNAGMKNYAKTGAGPALNKLLHLHAINRQGKEFPIELTVLPIKQDGEEFFCAFIRDITERKNSEEMLQVLNKNLEKRAQELLVSNQELEHFAYVASHDLQEPLRMVSSFMQLLEKKYKGKLDTTADQYIHFAVDGANRMKKLIHDLLEYSRVGTNKDIAGTTDMNEVMAEILTVYSSRIVEQAAVVTSDPLPVLEHARKTQMTQLLQNLIGNALKFQANEKLNIHISAKENETHWVFSVKDNGIGFDEKYADKIFVIFQRLHNNQEYAGTGIGLSICKKIVERHEGAIWVKSKPGAGSEFFFSIKK